MPSKDDRSEFLKIMYDWSIGKNSDKFYAFYAHLSDHGRNDGLPFLEKDLMFCIDSIRLKVRIKTYLAKYRTCLNENLNLGNLWG